MISLHRIQYSREETDRIFNAHINPGTKPGSPYLDDWIEAAGILNPPILSAPPNLTRTPDKKAGIQPDSFRSARLLTAEDAIDPLP